MTSTTTWTPQDGDPWDGLARQVAHWAASHPLSLRDAVVLLPVAQHLPLARQAFGRCGGWLPRIETTQTLAAALGPPLEAAQGQLSLDPAVDPLSAAQWLRTQSWAAGWEREDRRAFEQAVAAVVEAAQAMWRAAAARPPSARDAFWAQGRALIGPPTGPGARERALARLALEWAAAGPEPATDRLHALRPAAWIAVRAGGPDALVEHLLAAAEAQGVPVLRLDADPPVAAPFAACAARLQASVAVCDDFEDEAQRTAAQVLAHLRDGVQPVALIAQDRVLVRRVRALLARQQVPLLDETGWKLSTTRAGAAVHALLRAARAGAGTDDRLDWLKTGVAAHLAAEPALGSLERGLRRQGAGRPGAVDPARLEPAAAALWRAGADVLAPLAAGAERPLARWLGALRDALQACGTWQALEDDDAGRQVIAALRLAAPPARGSAWEAAAGGHPMDLDVFATWTEATLEQGSFVPTPSAPAPRVTVLPLARALLRPFAAVVCPGADEVHLGAWPTAPALVGDALARAWGLPDTGQQRDAQTLAFAHLLRAGRVDLLRRRQDGGTPLGASPLLERLEMALQAAAREGLPAAADPRTLRCVPASPVARPGPAAPALLPRRLSASACEALRACPYRFFALYMLGLREDEELDDAVEKRDYGTWLHEVLHRFHAGREAPAPAPDECARLLRIAADLQVDKRLDDAGFLPFAATFARFAPRYVAWLHARDEAGAQWLDGERDLSVRPGRLYGMELHGRLDRIDGQGGTWQLIDYKTGSVQQLREQLERPQEDTQLAFYAALVDGQPGTPPALRAFYLALDDAQGIRELEHPQVQASAERLLDGLARDVERLRDGAALEALGQGRACDFCAARGLCRRDHWAADDAGLAVA